MKRFVIACICILAVVTAFVGIVGAGSVTETDGGAQQSVKSRTFAWSITTNKFVSDTITGIDGEILKVAMAAQTKATNRTGVIMRDTQGVDIFGGNLINSNTAVQFHADNGDTILPVAHDGSSLTLIVTNANIGANVSTSGSFKVYWR